MGSTATKIRKANDDFVSFSTVGGIFPLLNIQPAPQLKLDSASPLQKMVIPDTIVFKSGHAASWYFSSVSESGSIKRKQQKNVTTCNIFSAWTKQDRSRKTKLSELLASWQVVAILVSNPDLPGNDKSTEAAVEYLDEALLYDFLEGRALHRKFNGILQKWSLPIGPIDSIMHAKFTRPSQCEVMCVTNVELPHDPYASKKIVLEPGRPVPFFGPAGTTQRAQASILVQTQNSHS